MTNKGVDDKILVTLGKAKTEVFELDEAIYRALFEDSVVYSLAKYEHSIDNKRITFNDFVELARRAEIPYTLFMAPVAVVRGQLRRKRNALLAGSGKKAFSLSSRGSVELRDIELILKDILRKQTLPKKYSHDADCNIVGVLKGARLTIEQQAARLRDAMSIDLEHISKIGKAKTFDYLVECLGAKNIFVSQSSKAHMPQVIQKHVKFSGITIRDKKYPFIFLNNKDEEASFEPQGRKVLTLALLLVCIAKARFSAVTYKERSRGVIKDEEFQIAEELLMPETSIRAMVFDTLDDTRKAAELFSVTPSALLMRLKRFSLITPATFKEYAQQLKDEYNNKVPITFSQKPAETTAFIKYNSAPYSRKILDIMDSGTISRNDVRRVLLQNKAKESFLDELRAKL